jgi:acetyl-CoA carboxylase carboxyl transferase subunit alpha
MEYLDFEIPIKDLTDQLEKAEALQDESQTDMSTTIKELEKRIEKTRKDIAKNLTAWQRVQLSRHPNRPYTLAYIEAMTGGNFLELHGDRQVRDDKAMVGGWGKLGDQSVMFIGQQKGVNTKMRQYRNFGMANPEGYRKSLRLMKMAEKYNKPVVALIDTPGAFPGLKPKSAARVKQSPIIFLK